MSTERSNPISRREKLDRLSLIEEKARRATLRRPTYNPTEGQLRVLSSTARNIFNFSGNGGGKTTILANLAHQYAKGINPWNGERYVVPENIIFVVDNYRKIEEKILPELKKWHVIDESWLKRLGKAYTSRIQYDNGSVIDFYSSDADPSSFEGVEASVVLVDEPIPRPLYIALKRSLRKKGHPCRFVFSGTAISQAWLRKEVYEPWAKGQLKNTECFRLHTEDNKDNLDAGYIEELSSVLTEAEKEVRLKGGFFDTEALALAHLWNADKHIIPAINFKYDPAQPCVVAIDNHSVKPHTAILITATKDDRIIVVKEMAKRGNASQFAAALKDFMHGYTVIDIVCDSLGSMEMTSGEGMHGFIEGLRNAGIGVRPTLFKEKNAEDLVDRLRNALRIPEEADQYGERTPKIGVLSTVTGLISDIESAAWQKNRMTGEIVPKIDTSTKDHLSCLGYALATDLFYDKVRRSAPTYSATNVGGKEPEVRQAIRSNIVRARHVRIRARIRAQRGMSRE